MWWWHSRGTSIKSWRNGIATNRKWDSSIWVLLISFTISTSLSWLYLNVDVFIYKQKMNISIIIRRPFTCLTRLSFIVAINRSVVARRDTFARRPRRRTWPSSLKNFYAAGKWKKKSNYLITFVANVRVLPRSANNYYIFSNNNQQLIIDWVELVLYIQKFLYII